MSVSIQNLLNRPPTKLTRFGPAYIVILLILGFILLFTFPVTQIVTVTGKVEDITPHSLHRQRVQIVVLFENKIPIITHSLASIQVLKKIGNINQISLMGNIDSLNYEKRCIFFSFEDAIQLRNLFVKKLPVSLSIDSVETSYYQIVKSKF